MKARWGRVANRIEQERRQKLRLEGMEKDDSDEIVSLLQEWDEFDREILGWCGDEFNQHAIDVRF